QFALPGFLIGDLLLLGSFRLGFALLGWLLLFSSFRLGFAFVSWLLWGGLLGFLRGFRRGTARFTLLRGSRFSLFHGFLSGRITTTLVFGNDLHELCFTHP